jgi:DNA-binding protein HU-beta
MHLPRGRLSGGVCGLRQSKNFSAKACAGLATARDLVEQCVFPNQRGTDEQESELIDAVAERAELSKAAVNKAIDAMTEVITSVIAKGNPVALIGFGTFKSVMRRAHRQEPEDRRSAEDRRQGRAEVHRRRRPEGRRGRQEARREEAAPAKKPAAKPAAKKPAAKKK